MPLTTTPPLPVSHASRSASGQMTIALRTPYLAAPFLGVLNITQVTSGAAISGTVTFGSDSAHGGHATLHANPAKYTYLCGFVPSGTAFTVEVTYDSGSRAVTDIICTVTHAAVAVHAVSHPSAE
jgi:hypothetical protein